MEFSVSLWREHPLSSQDLSAKVRVFDSSEPRLLVSEVRSSIRHVALNHMVRPRLGPEEEEAQVRLLDSEAQPIQRLLIPRFLWLIDWFVFDSAQADFST